MKSGYEVLGNSITNPLQVIGNSITKHSFLRNAIFGLIPFLHSALQLIIDFLDIFQGKEIHSKVLNIKFYISYLHYIHLH